MAGNPNPLQPNSLGSTSLTLSIASISLVFGLGLGAMLGASQIPGVAVLLFACSASSAFLGLLGSVLGFAGLFGANRQRATAIAGLFLGMAGTCLFFVVLNAVA